MLAWLNKAQKRKLDMSVKKACKYLATCTSAGGVLASEGAFHVEALDLESDF